MWSWRVLTASSTVSKLIEYYTTLLFTASLSYVPSVTVCVLESMQTVQPPHNVEVGRSHF